MAHSRLANVHSRGLLGCTALQGLRLHEACQITAETEADDLQTDSDWWCKLPMNTVALVSLTEVHFEAYYGFKSAEIVGFCNMPNLERLHIKFSDDATCTQSFEGLSRLTSLCFVSDIDFVTNFSFDWQALQALRHLEIWGVFKADATFLSLAKVPHLQSVQLDDTYRNPTEPVLDELLQQLSAMKVLC